MKTSTSVFETSTSVASMKVPGWKLTSVWKSLPNRCIFFSDGVNITSLTLISCLNIPGRLCHISPSFATGWKLQRRCLKLQHRSLKLQHRLLKLQRRVSKHQRRFLKLQHRFLKLQRWLLKLQRGCLNVFCLTLSHLNKFRPHPCIAELIWQIYLYYLRPFNIYIEI